MEEVTKEKFKEIYFKYGKSEGGWDQNYWDQFFESPERKSMRYKVELPTSSIECRMMIVTDYSINEYRLFFLSIEREENFFDYPGKE